MADRGIRAVKAQIIFFYDPDTVGRRECGADQILEKGFIRKVKITTAGGDQVALYIQLQCKIRQADILLHFVGQMEKEGIAGDIPHHVDAVIFQIVLCKKVDQRHNDAEHDRDDDHGDGDKFVSEFFRHGSFLFLCRFCLCFLFLFFADGTSVFYLQMISHSADGLDMDVGTDTGQLFAQKAHVNFHVIFHGIGIVAPYPRKEYLLGKIAVAGLEQEAHDIKFLCRQAD